MPGTVVAISSASGREVRAAIVELEGVSNVILVGSGVHAVVDDAALRIPQLRNALQQSNVAFADIAVAAPSIEDVFVALLEDEGKRQ
jgi:pectate lyase